MEDGCINGFMLLTHVWMDGWWDGWMDGQMGGWMDAWMSPLTHPSNGQIDN